MLIHILDSMTLEKIDLIESYESCIWTERFIEAGDVTLVMGATIDNAIQLRPGTMLLHEDSNEPMLIETRAIKDGVLTAKGKTIEAFFNSRYVGPTGRSGRPDNIICYVVYNMQTRQSGKYAIPKLRTQDFELDTCAMGHADNILGFEPGHDAVLKMAQKYSRGIAVIRQHNPDTGDLELVFVTRDTTDRTQPGDDYLRFSPKDDTFSGVDEVYSLVDWLDVILVHAPKKFATNPDDIAYGWWPMSYPDHTAQGGPNNFQLTPADNPFDWRIQEIAADDIDQKFVDNRINTFYAPNYGYGTWNTLSTAQQEFIIRTELTARARDEWHKRQVKQKVVFDGEVPGEVLKYGKDYHLGDLVVVEGNFTGAKQKSMVSEHIRSHDSSGTRSYPTLSPPLDDYVDTPGTAP